MNNLDAADGLKDMLVYFENQLSFKQCEGTLEDGELEAFSNRFEALRLGIDALNGIDKIVNETDQDRDNLKAFVLACRSMSDIAGCPATIGVVEWAGWPECNGEIDECGDRDLWECWQKYFRERVEEEPICRICGCTQENACPCGCSWVEEDLCSRCAAIEKGENQC